MKLLIFLFCLLSLSYGNYSRHYSSSTGFGYNNHRPVSAGYNQGYSSGYNTGYGKPGHLYTGYNNLNSGYKPYNGYNTYSGYKPSNGYNNHGYNNQGFNHYNGRSQFRGYNQHLG
eukprot:GFUD01120590.1.p1 GENE.GFUD01120590.1~~GFUD01120590.1.p1  ORF type:complete len:115 (+),score=19.29 GFUD01120590.1:40-384(+)